MSEKLRRGRPPKEIPTKKSVQIRVSEDLWNTIKARAEQKGQTITVYVTRALEKATIEDKD